MLKCSELARIASDYIDGELGTRRNLSVKTHLMMCKHCRPLSVTCAPAMSCWVPTPRHEPRRRFCARLMNG